MYFSKYTQTFLINFFSSFFANDPRTFRCWSDQGYFFFWVRLNAANIERVFYEKTKNIPLLDLPGVFFPYKLELKNYLLLILLIFVPLQNIYCKFLIPNSRDALLKFSHNYFYYITLFIKIHFFNNVRYPDE